MSKSIIALLAILILNTIVIWQTYWSDYFSTVDKSALRQAYDQSQYVNPDSNTWIDDPPLYTLAGSEYVQGADPSSINFELQPLTKYLFGLTTLLFGNPLPLQLLLYNLIIVLTYLLARQILENDGLAIIPALLVSLDPLIRSHAHLAYLDLMQACLILLFLYVKPIKKPLLAGLLIGLIALSKSFMIGGLVFVVFLGYLVINHQSFGLLFRITLTSMTIYFLGYTAFFLHQHSLPDFIDLHWRIIKLYRGYVPEYPKGEVFRILVMGGWRKWFGDFSLASVGEWWLAWPLGLFGTALALIKNKWQGFNSHSQLALLFLLAYGLSISLKLVFPRYLIPLLPLLYIFSVSLLRHSRSK